MTWTAGLGKPGLLSPPSSSHVGRRVLLGGSNERLRASRLSGATGNGGPSPETNRRTCRASAAPTLPPPSTSLQAATAAATQTRCLSVLESSRACEFCPWPANQHPESAGVPGQMLDTGARKPGWKRPPLNASSRPEPALRVLHTLEAVSGKMQLGRLVAVPVLSLSWRSA